MDRNLFLRLTLTLYLSVSIRVLMSSRTAPGHATILSKHPEPQFAQDIAGRQNILSFPQSKLQKSPHDCLLVC